MTPADFQSGYGSQNGQAQSARPVLQVISNDRQNSAADAGQAANGGPQRQQSGFLNQSIDEIARLYVESPFSW